MKFTSDQLACPVETAHHRPQRTVARVRDFLVAKALDGPQQQRRAVLRLKLVHRSLELLIDAIPVDRLSQGRLDLGVRKFILEVVEIHVVQQRRFAPLLVLVCVKHVVQDTQQPRFGPVLAKLEPPKTLERANECLLHKVFRFTRVPDQSTGDAVDRVQMR